jgi:hypothetical protein
MSSNPVSADAPHVYRAKAEECRQLAAVAISHDAKENWLRQAANWNKLAKEAEETLSNAQ